MESYRKNSPKCSLKILAIETVFEQCSVALLSNDYCLAEKTIKGNRGQAEIILPMIDEVLKEQECALKDIDILAFNQGPGAFSSMRIGVSVVQALSFAYDIPCIGVSSLEILANKAYANVDSPYSRCGQTFASCIDARQNEIYYGLYQVNPDFCLVRIGDERLLPYGSEIQADFVTGNGAHLIKTEGEVIDVNCPTAYMVGEFVEWLYHRYGIYGVSAENALPVYLRHNAWKTLAEQGKK